MQYTAAQRAEALALLAEVGKVEASRRTGISSGTIACWGSRAGVSAPPASSTRVATEKRVATIAERKARIAEGLADAAERMLDELFSATWVARRSRTTPHERRTTVAAIAQAVETVQLLTGEATERIEQLTGRSVEADALAVVDELAERRAS